MNEQYYIYKNGIYGQKDGQPKNIMPLVRAISGVEAYKIFIIEMMI